MPQENVNQQIISELSDQLSIIKDLAMSDVRDIMATLHDTLRSVERLGRESDEYHIIWALLYPRLDEIDTEISKRDPESTRKKMIDLEEVNFVSTDRDFLFPWVANSSITSEELLKPLKVWAQEATAHLESTTMSGTSDLGLSQYAGAFYFQSPEGIESTWEFSTAAVLINSVNENPVLARTIGESLKATMEEVAHNQSMAQPLDSRNDILVGYDQASNYLQVMYTFTPKSDTRYLKEMAASFMMGSSKCSYIQFKDAILFGKYTGEEDVSGFDDPELATVMLLASRSSPGQNSSMALAGQEIGTVKYEHVTTGKDFFRVQPPKGEADISAIENLIGQFHKGRYVAGPDGVKHLPHGKDRAHEGQTAEVTQAKKPLNRSSDNFEVQFSIVSRGFEQFPATWKFPNIKSLVQALQRHQELATAMTGLEKKVEDIAYRNDLAVQNFNNFGHAVSLSPSNRLITVKYYLDFQNQNPVDNVSILKALTSGVTNKECYYVQFCDCIVVSKQKDFSQVPFGISVQLASPVGPKNAAGGSSFNVSTDIVGTIKRVNKMRGKDHFEITPPKAPGNEGYQFLVKELVEGVHEGREIKIL